MTQRYNQAFNSYGMYLSFTTLDEMGYSDDVADLLYYLYNEGNLVDSDNFSSFLHQKFSKNVEDKVMTLGQQAIQQAVQQAVQKTIQQESEETALRMLAKKFDINLIAEITKLSPEEIKLLAKKNNH